MNPLVDLTARPVIAHRGSSARAPENTMPAFQLAVEEGADAIEVDVRVTADGVPVAIHDAALDRTTDAAGPIAALPLERLRDIDAGARFSRDGGRSFPWRGRGVGIPTLTEVLAEFPNLPLILEIKAAAAQHAVRRILLHCGATERCMVGAYAGAKLRVFHEATFLRAATRAEIARLYLPWRERARVVRYRALCIPERYRGLPVARSAVLTSARRIGCPVHVWTVNSASAARRLWQRGVAGIITNMPAEIRVARDRG